MSFWTWERKSTVTLVFMELITIKPASFKGSSQSIFFKQDWGKMELNRNEKCKFLECVISNEFLLLKG